MIPEEVGTPQDASHTPNASSDPVTLVATSSAASCANSAIAIVRYAVTCGGSFPSERKALIFSSFKA
nr:hypothetical protein [Actinospica robiniae]